MANFTFCWRRWTTSVQSFRIQLQKKLATFDELNEEAARIHFFELRFRRRRRRFGLSSFLRSYDGNGNENTKKAIEK